MQTQLSLHIFCQSLELNRTSSNMKQHQKKNLAVSYAYSVLLNMGKARDLGESKSMLCLSFANKFCS